MSLNNIYKKNKSNNYESNEILVIHPKNNFQENLINYFSKKYKIDYVENPVKGIKNLLEKLNNNESYHLILYNDEYNADINVKEFAKKATLISPESRYVMITNFKNYNDALKSSSLHTDAYIFKENDNTFFKNLDKKIEVIYKSIKKPLRGISLLMLAEDVLQRNKYSKLLFQHMNLISLDVYSLSKKFNLKEKKIESLRKVALIHDYGKAGFPSYFFNKEDLDQDEKTIIRLHPIIISNILKKIPGYKYASKICIQHHEKPDGTGYPYGIKKEDIILEARILSVIDNYYGYMTYKPYRKDKKVFTKEE
jgi:HD-GYP domain-containing protein (c-di-GMP phosphodiesterase class II)